MAGGGSVASLQIKAKITTAVAEVVRSELGDIIADTFFTRWHTAFMAKATGGEDEFGESWAPLAPSTVERKRKSREGWQFSNPESERTSRAQQLASQFRGRGFSQADAEDRANRLVWGETETADEIPIGINTTELVESLHPDGSPEQIRDTDGNVIRLGTNSDHGKFMEIETEHKPARRVKPTADEARRWLVGAARLARRRIMERVQRG